MRINYVALLVFLAAVPRSAGAQGSLSLPEAVSNALDAYPALDAANARLDAAAAAVRQEEALRLPGASVTASATRFQENMIVAPLHSFNFSGPPEFDRTLIQSEWGLTYRLFDGGSRRGRVDATRANLSAARSAYSSAEMDVIRRVASTYLAALSAVRIDSAAQQQFLALESELSRATQLFGAGRAARVQVLRARAALTTARASEVSTRSNLRTLVSELSRLTGSAVTVGELLEVRIGADPMDDLPRDSLGDNPTLQSMRGQLASAQGLARSARATRLPQVNVQAGVVTFGAGSGNFSAEWRGGLAINYPIFTGGARGGSIERAEAIERAASDDLRTARLELGSRLDRAVITVEELDSRVEALEATVNHREEVVRIEQLALESGAGVQTDYLRAVADLFESRASLIDLRHRAVIARVEVAAITGQLSPAWLNTYLETVR